MALEITDANFEEVVLQSDKPVLVDFWAAWCGPCRMVGPIIDEIHGDHYKKSVDNVKVFLPIIKDTLLQQLPFQLHSIKVKSIGEERFFLFAGGLPFPALPHHSEYLPLLRRTLDLLVPLDFRPTWLRNWGSQVTDLHILIEWLI